MSDRQNGLMNFVDAALPGSKHSICIRHLIDNFKTQVLKNNAFKRNTQWTNLLKAAAYATTMDEFEEHVNVLTKSVKGADNFFSNAPFELWANAVFPGDRWGNLTNNQVESWNAWIKDARSMPPLAMVDTIRIQCMRMMSEKRDAGAKMTGLLCPNPEKYLQKRIMEAGTVFTSASSYTVFEVKELDKRLIVDLEKMTCSCRRWQIDRLPCKHACACIDAVHKNVYDYCDSYYGVNAYRMTYRDVLYPISKEPKHPDKKDPDFVGPPDVKTQAGRPKKKRIPSQEEEVGKLRCKLCKKLGHNRRTCREPRVGSETENAGD